MRQNGYKWSIDNYRLETE